MQPQAKILRGYRWEWSLQSETLDKDFTDTTVTEAWTKEQKDSTNMSRICKAWWRERIWKWRPVHIQRKSLDECAGCPKWRETSSFWGGVQRIVRPTHSKDDTHKSRCNSCVTFIYLSWKLMIQVSFHRGPFRHKSECMRFSVNLRSLLIRGYYPIRIWYLHGNFRIEQLRVF